MLKYNDSLQELLSLLADHFFQNYIIIMSNFNLPGLNHNNYHSYATGTHQNLKIESIALLLTLCTYYDLLHSQYYITPQVTY